MNKKIRLEDIKIEWLNKRCLVLISIFTHALNKHNGVVIDLRSADVLVQVRNHAHDTQNQELRNIYENIKRELRLSLAEKAHQGGTAQEIDSVLISPGPDASDKIDRLV